jgi:NADPH:quinone reductase-like Zn-dependent oxidoreductase
MKTATLRGTTGLTPAADPQTMTAVVQVAYGSAGVLRLAQIAAPAIAANEVLLRVHAAGLDRGTWHLLTGQPYVLRLVAGLRKPKNAVPGLDVAGTVVRVGPAVTGLTVGDEVFGFSKGSFADYAAGRQSKLARKPASITFEQAAVVPVSAVTALLALTDAGRVRPGENVLVTGASGGVGSYAVQLAKAFRAEVSGVCSTAKTQLVRSLGADHVIDYTKDDFADGSRRYDLILDIAGNPAISRLRRALAPGGTIVMVGGEEGGRWSGGLGRQLRGLVLSPFLRFRLVMLTPKQRTRDLERLTEFLEAGTVTPSIDRTYPLDQVPDAIQHLTAGDARGKVVITTGAAAVPQSAPGSARPEGT